MNKPIYRVAIIGTGMIANAAHIPAWKALKDDVEVVGVAGNRPEVSQETANRHGVSHWYGDPQKMLDELKPDIVSVCTPNVYHKAWSLAALKAGAHVLCEKPIAVNYADAAEMYAAAESVGRILYACQSMRFQNTFMAAKSYVDAGWLGEVYYSEINAIRRRGVPTWGFFHMKKHNAGGPLYDLGVHILDFLFWVIGNPGVKTASAMTYTKLANANEELVTSLSESGAPAGIFTPRPYDYHEFDVEDFAAGFLRLDNGATVVIKTAWALNLADNFTISIAGKSGGLQMSPLKLFSNIDHYQAEVTPKIIPDAAVPFIGHYGLTTNFVEALRGEEPVLVTKDVVLNVARTIEMLYRSAEEGREISLDSQAP